MRFGQRYSAPVGEPTKTLEYCLIDEINNQLRVKFKPRENWGNKWYHIYQNAIKQTQLYVLEGEPATVIITPPYGQTKLSILVLNVGSQSDPSYDAHLVARTYEETAPRTTLEAAFTPEIMEAIGDDQTLSNWVLTGYTYGQNCTIDRTQPTRCYIDIDAAGTGPTVSLYNHGLLVAQGTGTGSVTLEEQNDSGLSGSVTVSPSITTFAAQLYIRWPDHINVLRGTTNPPTVSVADIPFAGVESVRWVETADLAAGTYYYRLQSVSDTADIGDSTASESVTIPGPPEPPTNLAYSAGDAADTSIDFTDSITPGVTINVYLQLAGEEIMDLEVPVAVTANSYGYQLPALTYPGTNRLVVRAVKAGVEEKNLDVLELEFGSDGVYIPARPNSCEIDQSRTVVTGLSASIYVTQSTDAEEVAAAGYYVYAHGEDTVTTGADATGSFTGTRNGVRYGTVIVPLQEGWNYVSVFAYSAAGFLSESANEYAIYASTANAPAPSGFKIYQSRG